MSEYRPFTREFLAEIRYRGEETMKRWKDPPKVAESDGTYILTYCVENWIRTAVVSRADRAPIDRDRFLNDVPAFKEVFGEPVDIQGYATHQRGVCALFRFNDWLKNPFFPRNVQEADKA